MSMQIDPGHTIEFKPIHEANTTAGTPAPKVRGPATLILTESTLDIVQEPMSA